MRKFLLLCIFVLAGTAVFAQTDYKQLAPGAREQLQTLLNKPTMVQPPRVTPLGKNWFKLEMEIHMFSNEVSVSQVAAVFLDIENMEKYFDGKKSKLAGKLVSQGTNASVVDFVSTTIAPLGIKIRTPYRILVTVTENTAAKFSLEMIQTDSDNASNRDIKNFHAVRHVEAVTINGVTYTYIRMHTLNDANASILPGAQGIMEKNSGPANIEASELLIIAAKNKSEN